MIPLALCGLMAVSCASSLGANGPGDATQVHIRTPPDGRVGIALLRFYLQPGKFPSLRVNNGYLQPPNAAFVGGVAQVGDGNRRFVGLVAIVNFHHDGPPLMPKGGPDIEASQPFYLDYAGDLDSIGPRASVIASILRGIPGPDAWNVDWFNQPQVTTAAARSFTVDGASLLDATFRRLLGRPTSDFELAIVGPPRAQAAVTEAAPRVPSVGQSRSPAGTARSAQSSTGAPGSVVAASSQPKASPAQTSPAGPDESPGQTSMPPPMPTPSPGPTPAPSPAPTPGPTDTPAGLATMVLSGSTPGPLLADHRVLATSVCPAGSAVVGGGFALHTSSWANPNNSFRDMGEYPSATDGSPVESGPAPGYTTQGGSGGQSMTDAITTNFVICATGLTGSTQVIVQKEFGPALTGAITKATATCPAGTSLVGGGALTFVPAGGAPNLHLQGDFPSDAHGDTPASGASVNSWTAVANAGGGPVDNGKTSAFAICDQGGPATQVIVSTVAGPEASSSAASATADCPAGSVLLGGGVRVDQNGGPAQWGVHLIGAFPGAPWAPVQPGPPGLAWTGMSHSGGQLPTGTETSAFALCTKP